MIIFSTLKKFKNDFNLRKNPLLKGHLVAWNFPENPLLMLNCEFPRKNWPSFFFISFYACHVFKKKINKNWRRVISK